MEVHGSRALKFGKRKKFKHDPESQGRLKHGDDI